MFGLVRHDVESAGGAHDRIRTGDLVLTKDVLYLLSYVGNLAPTRSATRAHGPCGNKKRETRIELATLSLEG